MSKTFSSCDKQERHSCNIISSLCMRQIEKFQHFIEYLRTKFVVINQQNPLVPQYWTIQSTVNNLSKENSKESLESYSEFKLQSIRQASVGSALLKPSSLCMRQIEKFWHIIEHLRTQSVVVNQQNPFVPQQRTKYSTVNNLSKENPRECLHPQSYSEFYAPINLPRKTLLILPTFTSVRSVVTSPTKRFPQKYTIP